MALTRTAVERTGPKEKVADPKGRESPVQTDWIMITMV
jgi:hypothetical protein